jgi:hypothetical protein
MPQHVRSRGPQVRAAANPRHELLHHMLRQRPPVVAVQDERASQVTVFAERIPKPLRQGHIPETAALGGRDVAPPLVPFYTELSLAEVDVRPRQCAHLADRSPASPPNKMSRCARGSSAAAAATSRSYSSKS